MGRILIFTGKGGVGKTSVAAAHGRYGAQMGKKTLIVSTDMAHNLSDLFEMPLGKTVTQVSERLYALEVDPNYLMENEFKDMKQGVLKMLSSSKLPLEQLSQLTVFPGMDELFSLLKIMEIHESGAYDLIIVDCAPTGETLSLLKFPELLSWYMEKLFPIGKVAMRILSPISKTLFKMELPDQAALTDMEKLFVKLIALQTLIKDREITSIRLVAMPEKMIVEETKRNYMYMNLYNFNVDGIYINRILPKDIENPFFNEWLEIQNKYIEELEMVFGGIPLYKIPWFDTDLNGTTGIDKIADQVLSGQDVFSVSYHHKGETYEKVPEGYLLTLYLPCIEKGELNMHESTSDIIIKIGNFKRNIPKPSVLRNYSIQTVKLEDNCLKIRLGITA